MDTSAVLAILLGESDAAIFSDAIAADNRRLISVVSVLEAAMVAFSRTGTSQRLDTLLRTCGAAIVPFDEEQLSAARDAFESYGKGHHPAALNFGDCAAYALSKFSGEPLLFKGNDFARTDVTRCNLPGQQ